MAAKADHLGFSSLDTDSTNDPSSTESEALFSIPERLRPSYRAHAVSSALSAEDKATIRLEAAAEACLRTLSQWLGNHDQDWTFLGTKTPTSFDYLAFGYLALMLVPEVPSSWLRRLLRRSYPDLCTFVAKVQDAAFTGKTLPLAAAASARTASLVERMAWGVAGGVPGLAEEWHRQTASQRNPAGKANDTQYDAGINQELVPVLRAAACLPLLAGAVLLFRRLPAFGSPPYVYMRPRIGLGALGPAGTMLGYLSIDPPGNNSVDGRGNSGGFTGSASERMAGGLEEVSIEIGSQAKVVDPTFEDTTD